VKMFGALYVVICVEALRCVLYHMMRCVVDSLRLCVQTRSGVLCMDCGCLLPKHK
jgi:hypothetical protein